MPDAKIAPLAVPVSLPSQRSPRQDAVLRVVTRLRPTEWIFLGLAVAMVILIIYTGQTSALTERYLVTLKFVLVIGLATLGMFVRAYFWPTAAEKAEFHVEGHDRVRFARAAAIRTVREFSPIFALLAIYEVLHLLTPILRPHTVDAALIRIDHAVLGVDVGRWLNDHFAGVAMTKIMTYCYVSYAFASPTYAAIQYFRRKHRAFHDFTLAIAISALIGYTGYLLVPAVGPYIFQSGLYQDPLPGWGHGGIMDVIAKAKGTARDSFPSLHTAMTTVLLGMMWRDARRLFWTYLPIALGLYMATMYLRVHYAVDVAAGFATAAVALWAAPKINRWYQRTRSRLASRLTVDDPEYGLVTIIPGQPVAPSAEKETSA